MVYARAPSHTGGSEKEWDMDEIEKKKREPAFGSVTKKTVNMFHNTITYTIHFPNRLYFVKWFSFFFRALSF